MGVKHLWKLLEPAAQQVPLETLAYKTLAIDASIWLYQFIKIIYPVKNSTRSQSALDDENEFNVESPHILGFFHRICKLLYFGITPVFVFDGVPPKLKLETLAARRRKKEGASMDATKTAQQILHTQLKLTALNPHQLPKVTSLPHLKRKTTHDEFLLPLSTEFFDASWLTSQTIQDSRLPWLTSEIYPSSSSSSSHGLESDALLNEHQRLSQLRNESRRPSHQRLKTMLQHSKTPLDFSKQQLQHLVQRHKVTQQIHDLEKSGRKNQRIASDRSREYILVKNEDNEGKSLAGWRFQPATSSSPSFLTPNAPSVSKPNRDVPSKSSSLSSTWIPTSSSSSSSSSSTSLPLSLPSNAYFDHHALLQEDDDDDDDDDSENEDDELEFEVVPSLTLPSALQSLLPYLPSSFTQVFSLGTEMLMLALTWTTSQLHASYEACQKKIDQLTSTQDFKNPDWIAQFESYVFWEEYLDHVMAYQETHKKKVTSTFNPHDFGAPSPPPPSSSTTSQVSLNEPFPSTTRTCCMDPVDMKFDSLDAMDPQQRQRGQTLTTAFSEDDFKSSSDDLAFPPASIPKIVEPSMVKKINPSSLLLKRSKETVIHPTASSPTLAAPLPVLSSNETLKNDPGRTPHEHQTFSFLNEKVKEPFHAVSDVSTSFQNEGMTKSTILDTGSNSSVFHTVHEHYETQKTQQPVTEETQDEEGEEEEEEEEFEEITVNEPVPSTTSTSSNPIPMSTKMSPSLSESLSEPLSGSSLIPSLLTNSLVKDMNHPVVSKVQTPLPSSSPTSTPEQSSILPPVNNSSASSSSNTHASLTASMPSTSPAPPPTSPPSSLPSQLSPSNLFSHATMEPKPPSSSQKSINPVFDLRVELEKEQTHLVESYQKRTREASTIDNHLLEEVQCLLRYFGIPYIEAPSEAEAQCAYLSMTGVVHGVISDDSDVFLFGATHVYRHFFQDQKTVRLYKATTLTSKLGYSRTKLIDLAYLLGSDYTEGIPGIGPKTAQTLIQAFTSFSLHDIFNDPKRWPTYQSQLKPYTFPSSFPDPRVAQAYLHPDVLPLQPADVTWTAPQVPSLTTYLSEKLGWSLKKIQPMIAHVLHHYQQHTQHHQASLHFYYPLSQNTLSSENHRPSQLKRKKIKPKEEEEEGQSSASFQSREKEIVQHGHCIAFHSSLDVWLRQHWPQAVYLCIQDQKVGLICSTTVLKACLKAGFIQTSLGLTFPSQVTSTVASRTQFLLQLCQQWKQEALFPCLQGWRNEMYSVFGAQGEIEFLIERAAAGLFGVRTYGCHMTAFVADPTTHRPTHVWIAQRSATKATFPLMLDNSVAGGLTSYCTPSQVMKRECEEEAGTIPSQVYPTSEISYLTSPNLQAQLEFNPETQFVFDAPINSTWSPRPVDGEVDHFQLLSIEDCISALLQKQFKPNCALVLIDFLLRHSILTPENTDDYLTIVHGLHRPLEWDFPGPKKFPTTHTHA